MRIAPDVDALMWSITDSHDMAAAENFNKMFPDLKPELAKRMHLVQDFRQAKALHITPVVRPAFTPATKTARGPSKAVSYGSAFLVGAVIFGVAYFIALRAPAQADAPPKPRLHRSAETSAVKAPSDIHGPVLTSPGVNQPAPQPNLPQTDKTRTQGDHSFPLYGSQSDPAASSTSAGSKSGRPLTIALRQVPLATAIQAIGQQSNLDIEMAPNMPAPTVDANYEDDDAVTILKDMGDKYGFGVVMEGNDRVLLVPAANGN